ncbi:MAG: invasin domain 3-containing protein [Nitrospinota bacterium]|nr:invasin domain 3-containing protein [Nitrospinota bacterium]
MKQKTHIKRLVLGFLIAGGIFWGCQAQVDDLTGPSSLGNILSIQGLFGGAGIQNDGASQATILVEVFTADLIPVVGASVTLTTTLGTLGAVTLATGASGAATTTLTSGTITGIAFVTATVDNVSANTSVPII